jgi:hypothetical protein
MDFNSPHIIFAPLLQVRHHALKSSAINRIDHHTPAQISFSLACFFSENMALVRLKADKLTGGGTLKAFGRPSVGFDFWHLFPPGQNLLPITR